MLKFALAESFFDLVIYGLQICGDHGSGFLSRRLALRVAFNPGIAYAYDHIFFALRNFDILPCLILPFICRMTWSMGGVLTLVSRNVSRYLTTSHLVTFHIFVKK